MGVLAWPIACGGGVLFLTHKPRSYKALAGQVDVIVSLLLPREYGGEGRQESPIPVIDAPFLATKFPDDPTHLKTTVKQVVQLIATGKRVLVHCSAGIHRTGLFGYAVLRHAGETHQEALRMLVEARPLCIDATRFIERHGGRLL